MDQFCLSRHGFGWSCDLVPHEFPHQDTVAITVADFRVPLENGQLLETGFTIEANRRLVIGTDHDADQPLDPVAPAGDKLPRGTSWGWTSDPWLVDGGEPCRGAARRTHRNGNCACDGSGRPREPTDRSWGMRATLALLTSWSG